MKKIDSIVMFVDSVGTTLLANHAFNVIRSAMPSTKPNFYIIVPRRKSFYRDILSAYSDVRVVSLEPRYWLSTSCELLRIMTRKNVVLTKPTHRRNSYHEILLAFLLSRRGGLYLGYEKYGLGRKLQKYTRPLTPEKSVFTTTKELLSSIFGVLPDVDVTFKFVTHKDLLPRLGLIEGQYVVVHPFAASPMRELPMSRWISLLNNLSEQYPHIQFVISGAKGDVDEAENMRKRVYKQERVLSVAGLLSVNEVAYVLSKSACYIGVDTGITHLASMIKTPVIVVGNKSNPYWLPTYSSHAKILFEEKNCTCDGFKGGECLTEVEGTKRYRCMVDISDETISGALSEVLVR